MWGTMTRVKGGAVAKNRRRKVLKQAKGYFGSKQRLFKTFLLLFLATAPP